MKWIKIERGAVEPLEQSQNIIYTSNELVKELNTQTTLLFGQTEILITVQGISSLPENSGEDFQHPAIIQISEPLVEKLLIQTTATYQMHITETSVRIGPVVGLLLGDQHYYYHHRRLKEFTDAMGIYEKVGGLFVAFRYCSINWEEECIFGQYFNFSLKRWEYGKLPFPSVVYRRGFNSKNNFINEYKDVINWEIFNEIRFDKWEFYCQLKDNKKLNPYLPETALLNKESLTTFLDQYKKVILKPKKLSRGRGISIITLNQDGMLRVNDYRRFNEFLMSPSEIEDYLQEGQYSQTEYIIQPFLNLARINNRPWDIRIVMQKNKWNQWVCNGIECRLAPKGKLITNISNGGKALYLNEALELAFGKEVDSNQVNEDILSLAMEYCKMMDRTGIHFAEFGLDIALDNHQHYWFIEGNVRPTFKGFKALNHQIYKKICYEPILYSAAIAGFGGEDSNEL